MASSRTPAGSGPMPKRRQSGAVDVYVRIPASHAELLADLQALPARARAERLRLLATLGLRQAGPATAVVPPSSPTPPPPSATSSESAGAVTSQRKRANALKGSLFS